MLPLLNGLIIRRRKFPSVDLPICKSWKISVSHEGISAGSGIGNTAEQWSNLCKQAGHRRFPWASNVKGGGIITARKESCVDSGVLDIR